MCQLRSFFFRGQAYQSPMNGNSGFINPEWEKARQALEKVQANSKLTPDKSPSKKVQPEQPQQNPAEMYYQQFMYYTQYVHVFNSNSFIK